MRLRLTASVEGVASAPQRFEVADSEIRVGFDVDSDRHVTTIWVDAAVADWEQHLPSIAPGAGTRDQPHTLSVPVPPVASTLESLLQYIESLGSFWLGIRRIGWSEAEMRWVPETPEEEKRLQVYSLSWRMTYDDTPIAWDGESFGRLIGLRRRLDYLTIPMSFYREGLADFRVHRHVSAFYNFYFFLEGLYGRGKTKNMHVLEAFASSAQFTGAVEATRVHFCKPEMAENRAALQEFLERLNCDLSVEGLTRFLVHIRGELHHFSSASSRPKGHPLNQSMWRPVALFAFSICVHLVQQLANGTPLEAE